MSDKSKKPSKKNVLKKFFGKSLGRLRGESESSSQDPEVYIEEGTQRALAIADGPCEFRDKLTDAEIERIPLPSELTSEAYHRDRDYDAALSKYNGMHEHIQRLLVESQARIDFALSEGEDLSMFQKKPKTRGAASFYTKVERGKRVVLQWDEGGHPLGTWGNKFNEAIGCLVRVNEHWNVAFTFNSNPYIAFKNTWIQLLCYFVLEDDPDRRWKYVRATMHEKFKQYRDRLKKKFLSPPFVEDWQRIYGIPSTVPVESFAYLLLYWRTDQAKEESARNSANRRKNEDLYYGGSVSIPAWRYNVDAAGGDASLSTSWQVLHTADNLPEDQLQTQRQHWEHLAVEEQVFREANPDYPADRSILPLPTETAILHHEFPNAAAKGRTPLHGGPQKLTLGGTSRSRPSFSRNYGYSSEAQKIQELESQIVKQNETMANWREELITQMREEISQQLPQGQHYTYPTQGSYYPPQPAPQPPPPPPPQPPPSQQSSQEEQYTLNREQWERYQRFLDFERSMGNQ